MASYKNIVPFFYKWEGGLSKDKKDSASSFPCPTPYKGELGYHTSKGVTYKTWFSEFGEAEDERFFEMNNEDWGLIFKSKYWDSVKGDEIELQSIAECLVSWAWGSGARTAIKQMQRALGVTVDGIIGNQTLGAINNSNEVELFAKCVKAREMFFRYITNPRNATTQSQRIRYTNNQRFLRGWLNRLEDFEAKFAPKPEAKPIKKQTKQTYKKK